VRVTPRAGADSVDGVGPVGELRVRVRAAPAGGAANEAVRRTIARALDVAPSRVSVDRGAAGRTKRIAVSGIEPVDVTRLWPDLSVSG
jgi:hypothetical protein